MTRLRILILSVLAACLVGGNTQLLAHEPAAPETTAPGVVADQGGGINPITGGRRHHQSRAKKKNADDALEQLP